jgi:hypothetical protein
VSENRTDNDVDIGLALHQLAEEMSFVKTLPIAILAEEALQAIQSGCDPVASFEVALLLASDGHDAEAGAVYRGYWKWACDNHIRIHAIQKRNKVRARLSQMRDARTREKDDFEVKVREEYDALGRNTRGAVKKISKGLGSRRNRSVSRIVAKIRREKKK